MATAYDVSANIGALLAKLGVEKSALYHVYLKLGSNDSLSCFMYHSEKNELERNFFLGNPISLSILSEKLEKLYTIQVNNKCIQFIKSEKVRLD